jgi:hypothetical protein
MFRTLMWALHAVRYGEMVLNREYEHDHPLYIPGRPEPLHVKAGQRVEIIVYPVGK